MADAPHYMIRRWEDRLPDLFDEPDRQDVLDWLIANNGRARVILVGAGFTLNARRPPGARIPLWKEMAEELARDLRVNPQTYDALTLADFYRRNLGDNAYQSRMLNLLDDDLLSPGIAHAALWDSEPEAVITTNFIDTVLEKNQRAQRVLEDPDLAVPLTFGRRQLIYLHGHRSNFDSWVTGRSDYDDLPEKRSMLFARTRQLFAQFPLLAVGYSLTDPDFHLVYRQMVRAMDKRHPMGLAVVLPGRDSDAESAQRAARKYWEDLGLRVVRLRTLDEVDWGAQFERFFCLTKRIDRVRELTGGLSRAKSLAGFPQALKDNIQAWQSSQEDPAIDLVWQRDRNARPTYWGSVLSVARPQAVIEEAVERARQFNLARHRSSANTTDETDRTEQRLPELDARVWSTESGKANPRFEPIWSLLENERGFDWVWSLEDALRSGADRDLVASWLDAAVARADILDAHNVHARTVLLALLLLNGFDTKTVALVGAKAQARFNDIASALGAEESSPEKESELVSLLKEARRKAEFGTQGEARELYEQAVRLARECHDCNGPRLVYFALQGIAETTEEPRDQWQRFEVARDARGEPSVAEWWERVEELEHSLLKRRVQTLETTLDSFGYESSSWSSNNSGWALNVIRTEAESLGAPLSVLSWLTSPLFGDAPSLQWELEQRLRLNFTETGKWLDRHVRSGDLFRVRSERRMIADLHQGGSVERCAGVASLRQILLVGTPSRQHQSALLDIVTNCAEVLTREDIPAALKLVEEAWRKAERPRNRHAEALASLCHVCDWQTVSPFLGATSEMWMLRRSAASKFPWEHWLECDRFLESGGIDFLRDLSAECHPFDWPQVGWALVEAVAAEPADATLLEVVLERLEFASRQEDLDGAVVLEQSANAYCLSELCRREGSSVARMVEEAVQRGELGTCRIVAQATQQFALKQDAKQRFREGVGEDLSKHCLEDIALMVQLSDGSRTMPGDRVWAEMNDAWKTLPMLAPVLAPQFWSASDWSELGLRMRVGGHRGKPSSWTLQKLQLLNRALGFTRSREELLSASPDGLGFVREVPFAALASGDGVIANHAMYSLSRLGCYIESEHENRSLVCALRAAADDVRIGVAHGAAFTAGYLVAREDRPLAESLRVAARQVSESLATDPLAVVHRQAALGRAKGIRDAKRGEDS